MSFDTKSASLRPNKKNFHAPNGMHGGRFSDLHMEDVNASGRNLRSVSHVAATG